MDGSPLKSKDLDPNHRLVFLASPHCTDSLLASLYFLTPVQVLLHHCLEVYLRNCYNSVL